MMLSSVISEREGVTNELGLKFTRFGKVGCEEEDVLYIAVLLL